MVRLICFLESLLNTTDKFNNLFNIFQNWCKSCYNRVVKNFVRGLTFAVKVKLKVSILHSTNMRSIVNTWRYNIECSLLDFFHLIVKVHRRQAYSTATADKHIQQYRSDIHAAISIKVVHQQSGKSNTNAKGCWESLTN